METLRDSVETSVSMKLFPSLQTASYYHIFKSELEKIPLSTCRELENFNPVRLSDDPYPEEDRPRGQADLDSVLYHRRRIAKHGQTEPIWLALKDGRFTLLDGAHRIVAAYLERKRTLSAYIVRLD